MADGGAIRLLADSAERRGVRQWGAVADDRVAS